MYYFCASNRHQGVHLFSNSTCKLSSSGHFFTTGCMAGWMCSTPPQIVGIPHGKSPLSASDGSSGNPSSFSAGPGQAACSKCSHTAVFKAMTSGPEAEGYSRSQNHTASPAACHPFWGLTGTWQKNLQIAVPAEFLCFHCKLAVPGELLGQNCAALQSPFFGVKLRDYEAEGIIHHYWL